MRRRDFALMVLGSAVMCPLRVHAQQSPHRIPRIGVLLPGTPASFSIRAKAFVDGLKELGDVERRTIEIEWKWANDRVDVLPDLAAELARGGVDVIVTGGTPAARAAEGKSASPTRPSRNKDRRVIGILLWHSGFERGPRPRTPPRRPPALPPASPGSWHWPTWESRGGSRPSRR